MDGKPLVQQFQDDLREVIKKYYDSGLTLGEAIGVMELVKMDVYNNGLGDDEDDDLPY